MKTPKEKAEELVDKMYQYSPLEELEFFSNSNMAKKCALIAVDELIKLYEYENPSRGFKVSYWDEVKTELENL